jgi:uncharacterized protein YgiM (DUF1202 family)
LKANDNVGHGGRCMGSANCTACKNCSGCGHCSSGGSCSVCRGGSHGRGSSSSSYIKNKSKNPKNSGVNQASKAKSNKPPKVFIDKVNVNLNSNNRYIAGAESINIYEKPTFKSKIITTVPKDTKLIKLSTEGSWHKILVKSSGKKGYASNKYVK